MYWRPVIFFLSLLLCLRSPCANCQAATPETTFATAAEHYAQGRWELASHEFAKFLTDHADHANASAASFFLGESLVQLGRYPDALGHFASYLSREANPKYAKQALFRCGEAAHFSGDSATANQRLSEFATKYPQDELLAFVFPYLGQLAVSAGDHKVAKQHFEQTLTRFPQSSLRHECQLGLALAKQGLGEATAAHEAFRAIAASDSPLADEALLRDAILYYKEDDADSALTVLDKFETRHPQSSHLISAKYWRGLAHTAKADWPAAQATLEQAAAAAYGHPLAPAIEFALGEVLRRSGKLAESREHYRNTIAIGTKNEWADDALHASVSVELELGDFERVAKLARRFSEQFPTSSLLPYVTQLLGRSQLADQQPAEAVETLKPLVASFTAESEPLLVDSSRYYLALAQLATEQYADALSLLEKVAARDGADDFQNGVRSATASALIGLKRFQEAVRPLEEYLAQAPTGPDAAKCRAQLIAVRAELGQPEKSSAAYEELVNTAPDDPLVPRAALARAAGLEQNGEVAEAFSLYSSISEKFASTPQHPTALFGIARTAERLGRHADAVVAFQQLLKKYPNAEFADAALYQYAWVLVGAKAQADAEKTWQTLHRDFVSSKYWPDATYRLAELAWRNKDEANATALLQKLGQRESPPDIAARVLYLQGQIAAHHEDWPKLAQAMRQIVENFPDSDVCPQAEYWLAEADFRSNNIDAALERFAKLDQQLGDRREEWCAMVGLRHAQLLMQKKRWSEALAVASSLSSRSPNFRLQYEVDHVLGRSLASQANFAEARAAYERVIQSPVGGRTETAAMSQWLIGETFFHQKKYADAVQAYSRVERLFDYPRWRAAALLQAAKCHELTGNGPDAVRIYAQILQQFPDSPFTAEASRRLKVAQSPTGSKVIRK